MSTSTLRKIVGAAVVVLVLIAASLYRVPTTFEVRAVTQLLVLETSPDHRSPWYVAGGLLSREGEVARPFTGTLLVAPGARVVFERIGSGPLRMDVTQRGKSSLVAIIEPAGGDPQELAGPLVLEVGVSKGTVGGTDRGLVLPMVGRIEVGAEVGVDLGDRPALLQEGSVTLLAHTMLGGRRYDAGSATLEFGDYPRLDWAGDAHGLLVVGPGPNMTAGFRVVADRLHISRFGSTGYDIYASWLDRLKNDYVLQGLWAATIFILAWLARIGPALPSAPRRKEGAHVPPTASLAPQVSVGAISKPTATEERPANPGAPVPSQSGGSG